METDDDASMFLQLYNILPYGTIARAMLGNSEKTKSALEFIVDEDPESARKIITNAFDDQTGLYTKERFENVLLPRAISNSQVNNAPLCYIIFDLDNFHRFNESYGHIKGDEAISRFVEVLKDSFRTKIRRKDDIQYETENRRTRTDRRKYRGLDQITRFPINNEEMPQGRVGKGEEFAVILYGCDEEKAKELAERVLERVRNTLITYDGAQIRFTVSAGISKYQEGMSPVRLRENADNALNASKSQGRDRVTLYS